jgi:hypothetical protein
MCQAAQESILGHTQMDTAHTQARLHARTQSILLLYLWQKSKYVCKHYLRVCDI